VLPFKLSPFLRTFLALLALSLVPLSLNTSWTGPAAHLILWPYALLQRGIISTAHAAERRLTNATWDREDSAELERLRARVVELEARLQREIHQRQVAESRLNQYLALPEVERTQSALIRLVGYSPSPLQRRAVFDKGSPAGIKTGMPVFWYGAVLGRVESAGPGSCTVLLITDPKFRMGVRCERTRVQGILQGLGRAQCRIKDIAHDQDVKPGDVFVSSGLDGVFPPGHLVGIVATVSKDGGGPFQWIELRPACDPDRVERATALLNAPGEGP